MPEIRDLTASLDGEMTEVSRSISTSLWDSGGVGLPELKEKLHEIVWEIYLGKRVRVPLSMASGTRFTRNGLVGLNETDLRRFSGEPVQTSIAFQLNRAWDHSYWDGSWSRGGITVMASRTPYDNWINGSSNTYSYSSMEAREVFRNNVVSAYRMFTNAMYAQKVSVLGNSTFPPGHTPSSFKAPWMMTGKTRAFLYRLAWTYCAFMMGLPVESLTSAEAIERSDMQTVISNFTTYADLAEYDIDTYGSESVGLDEDQTSLKNPYSSLCYSCHMPPRLKHVTNGWAPNDSYANYWQTFNAYSSHYYSFWPNASRFDDDEYNEDMDQYGSWVPTDQPWEDTQQVTFNNGFNANLCVHCVGTLKIAFCEEHEGWYSQSRSREGVSSTQCTDCNPAGPRHRTRIMNYSWRPEWRFFHALDQVEYPVPGVLFMGMEIETEFHSHAWADRYETLLKQVSTPGTPTEDFMYGKSDSSISNGVELVTHPFTYDWAKEYFPFNGFQTLIDEYQAIPSHVNTGCHVHVARSSFTPTHMWKFLAVHEYMADLLGLYGRRGADSNYGSLHRSVESLKRQGIKKAYAKHERDFQGSRSGVHMAGDTVELRYPAGATDPTLQKQTMQLVQALYDFSKDIDSSMVMKGVLKDGGFFMGYVNDHQSEYPDLHAFQQTILPAPKSLTEV